MTTRFYIPSSGTPSISPAFSAAWDGTISFRRTIVTMHIGSSMGILAVGTRFGSASGGNQLMIQLITAPLSEQTIGGTIKGQILAGAPPGKDTRAQMVVRLFSGDGATERGVLLPADNGALVSKLASFRMNRKFPAGWFSPGAALTAVDAEDGDRLVVEIGYRLYSPTPSSASLELGDNAASDLPEDETTTDQLNPWIEFSQDLEFQAAAGGLPIGAIAAHQFRMRRR